MSDTKRKNPVEELRKLLAQVRAEYGDAADRVLLNEPDLTMDFGGSVMDFAVVKDRDIRFRAYQAMKELLKASPAAQEARARAEQMDRALLAKRRQYVSIAELCAEWVYVTGVKRFVRQSDGMMYDREQFDAAFNYLTDAASLSKRLFKDSQGLLKKFERIAFAPGKPEIYGETYNTWRASAVKPVAGDTAAWDAHLEWLFADSAQRNYLLDWLAWTYQNPTRRPGYALLLLGETQGTGKSIVARVMEYLIGGTNTQRPKNSSLKGAFNSYAFKVRLVLIEELMQIGRREVANELRDLINEPSIAINIKNVPQFTAENFAALLAVSNNPDALPMVKHDRRWLVVESRVTQAQKERAVEDGYFQADKNPLLAALDDGEASPLLAAIAASLSVRDVSAFRPGEAPMTSAKRTMIELSATACEDWLERNRIELSARTIVNVHDDIVTRAVIETSDRPASVTVSVRKWLKQEVGVFALGDVRVKDRGAKQSRVVKLLALGDFAAEVENYPGGLEGYKATHDIAAMYETERAAAAKGAAEFEGDA